MSTSELLLLLSIQGLQAITEKKTNANGQHLNGNSIDGYSIIEKKKSSNSGWIAVSRDHSEVKLTIRAVWIRRSDISQIHP